jgi:hypothetical protein
MARLGSIWGGAFSLAKGGNAELATYDFTVENVFPDHHSVDAGGVIEGQKCKASRTTRSITHNGASVDLAKLCKVIPKAVYKMLSTER